MGIRANSFKKKPDVATKVQTPTKVVKQEKPKATVVEKPELKPEQKSAVGMFGQMFGSKKTDEQTKSKATEKKSMFGFFSKAEKEEKPLHSQDKATEQKSSKSTGLQNMSVIKTFRGQEPKARKLSSDDDLPDLSDKNVVEATIKIQSAFKGYRTRKIMKLDNVASTAQAAIKIQSAYRRY